MKLDAPDFDELLGVVLFGSHARGDADASSDIDVCVFTASMSHDRLQDVKNRCVEFYSPVEVSVSIYTELTANAMASCGALFSLAPPSGRSDSFRPRRLRRGTV